MELGNMIFGNSRGEYSIDRSEMQDLFTSFLTDLGFNAYGYLDEKSDLYKEQTLDGITFENDIFLIRPYYWGDEEDLMDLPNFVYKPKNLEICWYKYPLRDAYSNVSFSKDEFKRILEDCKGSYYLCKREGVNMDYKGVNLDRWLSIYWTT